MIFRRILAGMCAALALCATPAKAEPPREPEQKQTFWIGTDTSAQGLDAILEYKGREGLRTVVTSMSNPWAEQSTTRAGFESPTFAHVQLVGIGLYTTTENRWGYGGILRATPTLTLVLRAGGFHAKQSAAGFVGTRYADDVLTIDADIWYDDLEQQVNAHGFASVLFSERAYISIGGDLRNERLDTLVGWIHPGQLGVFLRTQIDLKKELQQGILLIADRSTRTRAVFDYKNHVFTQCEMGNTPAGVLYGWAPLEAKATMNIADGIYWKNTPKALQVKNVFYYRINDALYVALHTTYDWNKEEDRHAGSIGPEVYLVIPRTPLDVQAKAAVDVRTGEIDASFYLGAYSEF